jgi:ribonucleoside-diphosphate reductase alpha chain
MQEREPFDIFDCQLSQTVWSDKYRFKGRADCAIKADASIADTMYRVATAIFRDEDAKAILMAEHMKCGELVPAGRIISGAGTGNRVTMMNCYVMGKMEDSLSGIMSTLNDTALTMQQGGGTGTDFSPLRPMGAILKKTGSFSSGPMPFMDMWHAMCSTIMSAGHRRGAMMGTMRIDHPDILSFIAAKQTKGRMTNFNVSVLVTDAFMTAVRDDLDWHLISQHAHHQWSEEEKERRIYSISPTVYIWHTMKARVLWTTLMKSTYEYSEPGVIFVDRINKLNNLRDVEEIACTNPCGEQPLPPFGACNLGHVNLAMFVQNPWTPTASIKWIALEEAVRLMTEFLDNVIDETLYPLEAQREEQMRKRRIGLGVTGLADMLSMLNLSYGSSGARAMTSDVMRTIARAVYRKSIELADIRGPAPIFQAPFNYTFAEKLGPDIAALIREKGIRNGVCLTVAPTGTTSVFYGNVSSGIEPVFAHKMVRKVRQVDDTYKSYNEYSFTVRRLAYEKGIRLDEAYDLIIADPKLFPTVNDLTVDAHLNIMSAVQEWVDASVSKTINLPADIGFEDFMQVYERAYNLGCKGCTTYRPSDVRGSILESADKPKEQKAEVVAEAVSTPVSSSVVSVVAPSRRQALEGRTYKFKWPSLAAAMYITINHDDVGMPTELFIHSKNAQFVEWSTALSVMITKLLQASRDPMMVAAELKQINLSLQPAWEDGTMYGSIIARIGAFIEEHYREFEEMQLIADYMQKATVATSSPVATSATALSTSHARCSYCGSANIAMKEGCLSCNDCGNSKCN